MFNPDGSSMGMCGNGIRCIVRFEFLAGQVQVNQSQKDHGNSQHQTKSDLRHVVDQEGWLHYAVEGRAIRCRTNDEGLTVTVDMGSPSFLPEVIPLSSEKSIIDEAVNINLPDGNGTLSLRMTALSMGNPHGVLLELPYKLIPDGLNCNLLERMARKFGPILENDRLFPNRANIEFVEIENRKQIHVAVWERAAGFTLACGTGACAAVVAYVKSGKIDPDCTVILPGGAVNVLWDMESDKVYLTGQVGVIAEGLLVV
jgi:diaminopimelate epimerase